MLLASELTEMMRNGESVVIRNTQPGIVVFTDDSTKIVITWDGSGDPYGGDIREIAPTVLANPVFREQILRGIFTIEEAPEALQNAMDGMREKWSQHQERIANAAVEIEKARDQVVATAEACIAPKGKELCGSYSLAMGKDASERPPLCAEHVAMAGQYVSSETGREVNGKPEVVWKRARLVRA